MAETYGLVEWMTILRKKIHIIGIGMMAGLILSLFITKVILVPKYSTSTQLLVSRPAIEGQVLNLTDIQTNIQLINTYKGIIEDPVILDVVAAETAFSSDLDELRKRIAIEVEDDSQIFRIRVTDTDPQRATLIANTVAKTFQENVGKILSVENVAILSPATVNPIAVSPNVPFNLVIGAITGALLGTVVGMMQLLMNRKVQDEETVMALLQWRHLGTVSQMSRLDRELESEPRRVTEKTEKGIPASAYGRKEAENVS